MAKITIATTVDPIIHQAAKDNNIAWNNALEFGILFLIADKDGVDYPDCNLLKKVQKLAGQIVELTNEDVKPVSIEVAEKEAEEILKTEVIVDDTNRQ